MSIKERLTIMILEDNHADVYLLKEALLKAELNFAAVVFEDGESAFQYIDGETEADAAPLPDVAILDLNVPKRDGSEVLGHIRQHPKLQHIPVLILSSSPKHVMRNRAAEADCYITKPVDLEAFLEIGGQIRDCVETVWAARVSDSIGNQPGEVSFRTAESNGGGDTSGTHSQPHPSTHQMPHASGNTLDICPPLVAQENRNARLHVTASPCQKTIPAMRKKANRKRDKALT